MSPISYACNSIETFLDFEPSRRDLETAAQIGDHEGVQDAFLRQANAHFYFLYLVTSTLRTISQGFLLIHDNLARHNHFVEVFESPGFIATSTIFGYFTNAITCIQESIGVTKQISFLFFNKAWKEEPVAAVKGLFENRAWLEKRVRPWFLNNLELKEGPIKDITVEKAQRVLAAIRTQAIKKSIVHLAGWISTVICLVGLALANPILLAVGFAVWGLRFALQEGMLDNPDGGFSILRLLPQFLANCLKKPETLPATALQV